MKDFCDSTGYCLKQQVVDLKQAWRNRRARWFGLLTAPARGLCELSDMPRDPAHQLVGQVMPYIRSWDQVQTQTLMPHLYEMHNYAGYAAGGVENHYLTLDGTMATTLHSLGGQFCRAFVWV